MTDSREYVKARKRAEAKYGFFVHAAVYTGVMTLLAIVNVLNSPGTYWFIWPLLGWGVGLLLHGLGVYKSSDKTVILDALTERELHASNNDNGDKGQ